MRVCIGFLLFLSICCSCKSEQHSKSKERVPIIEQLPIIPIPKERVYIDSTSHSDLIFYYPKFTSIDFVCGARPDQKDSTIIFIAAGAFTGELKSDFTHRNIAGDHVSGGVRFKGYSCSRNTGAFVWYNNKWKFGYQNYSDLLDQAAQNGGMGFGQEMIVHKGEPVQIKRKAGNKNIFRALCEKDGRLCIIESKVVITYGKFRDSLLGTGVKEALYVDMGRGWNYAWYRNEYGAPIEIHKIQHKYSTNWIVFYD